MQQIVERALAKEAGARYQSAAAMADELAHAQARALRERPARERGVREPPAAGDPTWVAPRFSPRRNVNPAARRRRIAALTVALGLLCAMVVAAIVLTAGPTVRVPQLRGLSKDVVNAKLRHLHLRADFAHWFSSARPGTVVSQTPAVGTRVKQDSAIKLALSKGPRPVEIPSVKGLSSGAAVGRLHRASLRAKLVYVAAPGTTPGMVTGESPGAGEHRPPHSTITLSVAETPTWRYVTAFSGEGAGRSSAFKIRGSQWRIVYRMSYDGTCDFVLFCNGPSAQVVGVGTSSTEKSFDLSDGDNQTEVFKTGAGQYQVAITPGWDAARWSITVEDWF